MKNVEWKSNIGRTVLVGLFVLVLSAEHGHGQEIKLSPDQLKAAGIKTAKPEPLLDTAQELKLSGYFSHSRLGAVAVSSLEAATVTEVLKDNLSPVKAGEPLLKLSSEAWFRTQQEHVQNRTSWTLAQQGVTRDKGLFDEGLIAQRRLLDAQAQLTMAQAAYQNSRQRLKLMGAGEGQIKQLETSGNLSPTLTLHAPLAGSLSGLDVTAGKHVEAGRTLFQVIKPGALELVLTASPVFAKEVRPGQSVNVKDCLGHTSSIGKVLGVGGQLAEGSQTVPIRVSLTAKPQALNCFRVNQFTEAFVQTPVMSKGQSAQFKVPAQAVVVLGKKTYVFVKLGTEQQTTGFEAVEVESNTLTAHTTAIRETSRVDSKASAKLSSSSELAISGTVLLKGAMQGLGAE